MFKTQKEIEERFDELYPISIDYPPITEMEVFTQIEIDRRVKRAKAKNEDIKLFLHSTRQADKEAVMEMIIETNNFRQAKADDKDDWNDALEQSARKIDALLTQLKDKWIIN